MPDENLTVVPGPGTEEESITLGGDQFNACVDAADAPSAQPEAMALVQNARPVASRASDADLTRLVTGFGGSWCVLSTQPGTGAGAL